MKQCSIHLCDDIYFVFSVDIRPENEYEKLLRLSNEHLDDVTMKFNLVRPCDSFSLRYECACDLYQLPCHRAVQNVSQT
jgi:hypothetical protein